MRLSANVHQRKGNGEAEKVSAMRKKKINHSSPSLVVRDLGNLLCILGIFRPSLNNRTAHVKHVTCRSQALRISLFQQSWRSLRKFFSYRNIMIYPTLS